MIGIPLVAYYLYFSVAFNGGELVPGPTSDWSGFLRWIVPTAESVLVYAGWLVLQVALHLALPGRVVDGLPLEDGSRLRYKLNGLFLMIVSLAIVIALNALDLFSLAWIRDNFGACSRRSRSSASGSRRSCTSGASGGRADRRGSPATSSSTTSSGRHSTRRIPPVDRVRSQFFFESRPGLIGWVVVVLGLAAAQLERDGRVTLAMALVVGLQLAYVASYFWSERGVLSMIDIRTERFGWMLVYGSAALVPMTYSIQAFYLIDHVPDLPVWFAIGVVALFAVGHFIFRSANSQKDRFRRDPDNCRIWGRPAEYIATGAAERCCSSPGLGPCAPYELPGRLADGRLVLAAHAVRLDRAVVLPAVPRVAPDLASAPR